MKNAILLLTVLASSQSFATTVTTRVETRVISVKRVPCEVTTSCLAQVSPCRMSDRSFEIEGNELIGHSKFSYSFNTNKICHKKYESVTYPMNHSDQDYFTESSVIAGIRMPDSVQEVSASNKAEVRRMDNCKEARADLIATYPRCK